MSLNRHGGADGDECWVDLSEKGRGRCSQTCFDTLFRDRGTDKNTGRGSIIMIIIYGTCLSARQI